MSGFFFVVMMISRKGESLMWIEAQINPLGKLVGDCVIRAIAIATGMTWDETYIVLSDYGIYRG